MSRSRPCGILWNPLDPCCDMSRSLEPQLLVHKWSIQIYSYILNQTWFICHSLVTYDFHCFFFVYYIAKIVQICSMAIIIYNIQFINSFCGCKAAYRVLRNSKFLLSFSQTAFQASCITNLRSLAYCLPYMQISLYVLMCCLCYCNKNRISLT